MDPVKNRGRTHFFGCFKSPAIKDGAPPLDCGGRTKTAHQIFYAWLKAVFFRTPLAKKLKSKRHSRRKSYQSSSNLLSLTKTKKLIIRKKTSSLKGFSDQEDNSLRNSSTHSISRAPSISSERNEGYGSKRGGSKYNPVTGMCIISVCLVALVFGGKGFAIVTCISTCLVFAPWFLSKGGGAMVKNVVVESEEDRKKIILDGLLERDHSRLQAF